TIAFSTAPRSLRSFRGEISCLPEQLWQARRAISRDHFRRNNTGTGALGLSLPSVRLNLDPNSCAQTNGPCENAAVSLVTIQMFPTRVRFAFPNRRAAGRSRGRCRGCPSLAEKNRSLSREARDLSCWTSQPHTSREFRVAESLRAGAGELDRAARSRESLPVT